MAVCMDFVVTSPNTLTFNGKEYRCAVGKNGIGQKQAEGDNLTPIGAYPIRYGFYRPDRIEKVHSKIPFLPISSDLGWCDDPADQMYNRLVKLPYEASFEDLWREDHVYDLVLVVGYNDNPVVAGKGSAIFIHLARENYEPTAGCVALDKDDLLEILPHVHHGSRLIVLEQGLRV